MLDINKNLLSCYFNLTEKLSGPLHALYMEHWSTGGQYWGEVCLPLSEKAESCPHMLLCHSGTDLLLPLLLPTLGLWYLVALAGTLMSPVAAEN